MRTDAALFLFWICTCGASVAFTLLIVDASKYYVGVTASAIFWIIGLSFAIRSLSYRKKGTKSSYIYSDK